MIKSKIAAMLTVMLLTTMISCAVFPAYGEHDEWNCPECGRRGNKGNFCGLCGFPAKWQEPEAWESISVDKAATVDAPVIVSQPQSVAANEGTKVFLTAVVEGAT